MPSIRILYDEQIFLLQEHGGISRYFSELIKTFQSHPEIGIEPVLASNSVRTEYLLQGTDFLGLHKVKSKRAAFLYLLLHLFFKRKLSDSVDLVHHTFYLPGFFSRFRKVPKAITLFDMIPEKTQSNRRLWNPHFAKRFLLPKADLVFSISESSTKDMFSEYNIEIPVSTTYLGVGAEYTSNLPRLDWLPKEYFLFVGNRAGYKDCDLAIRAFARFANQSPGKVLLLVGGGPLDHSEKALVKQLGVEAVIMQRSVRSEELPNVYSNALGLVYTSRYEGFGLPLVESMATRTPIIASDTPINTEIAERAASYFPVGDERKLAQLMGELASNPDSFLSKIEEGASRAKSFTWYNCARRTADEYRRIVDREKD